MNGLRWSFNGVRTFAVLPRVVAAAMLAALAVFSADFAYADALSPDRCLDYGKEDVVRYKCSSPATVAFCILSYTMKSGATETSEGFAKDLLCKPSGWMHDPCMMNGPGFCKNAKGQAWARSIASMDAVWGICEGMGDVPRYEGRGKFSCTTTAASDRSQSTNEMDPQTSATVDVEDDSEITNADVREAQELLAALGYDPGPADGLWGPRTSEAYQSFLYDTGAPTITEVLTVQTLRALRKAVSSVRDEDVPAEQEILTSVDTAPVSEPVAAVPETQCIAEGDKGCWKEVDNRHGCFVFDDVFYPDQGYTWTGNCADGFVHGSGTEVWTDADGSRLTGVGTYVDARKHGRWTQRWADGDVAEGPYVSGERHGHWIQRWADGGVAEGPYVSGKRHGRWETRRADGVVFEVSYVSGETHDRWTIHWVDGDIEEGLFVDGRRHGHWEMRRADGGLEKGPYVSGERHGHWEMRSADGGLEKGPYVSGERHGHWTLRWADGNIEEGRYVSGERHGHWTIYWADGDVWEGPFDSGEKHGHWEMRSADGGLEKGPYVSGEKHGHWILRRADGGVEEGPYVNGEAHGRWTIRWADGEVWEAIFVNDELESYALGERVDTLSDDDYDLFDVPDDDYEFDVPDDDYEGPYRCDVQGGCD